MENFSEVKLIYSVKCIFFLALLNLYLVLFVFLSNNLASQYLCHILDLLCGVHMFKVWPIGLVSHFLSI